MDSKFQAISQFIDKLEESNSIQEEQALLLVGGAGIAVKTNAPCSNETCSNAPCMNGVGCNNGGCSNGGCSNSGCK